VVRWFGGVKLGTGGLSRAYRESASATLRDAATVERFVYDEVRVIVPFDMLGIVYRLVSPPEVLLAGETYGETNVFTFSVRKSRVSEFLRELVERRLERQT